jgi:ABC-type iron transport system FetAB permease component
MCRQPRMSDGNRLFELLYLKGKIILKCVCNSFVVDLILQIQNPTRRLLFVEIIEAF